MRFAGLLVLPLVVAAATAANLTAVITAPTVRVIESMVVMPRGAESLANYDRYYLLDVVSGHEMVVGRFLLRTEFGSRIRDGAVPVTGVPNAFVIPRGGRLPVIADGGCAVVTIYFSTGEWRMVPIRMEGDNAELELGVCNGEA